MYVITNDVSLFFPTRYSARHVWRKMDQHFPLHLLLFLLLLTLREAAFLIQTKPVVSCKALQEPAYCMALSLDRERDTTLGLKAGHHFIKYPNKSVNSKQDLQMSKGSLFRIDVTDVVSSKVKSNCSLL